MVGNTAVVTNRSVTARYIEILPDSEPYLMNGCDAGSFLSGTMNLLRSYWWIALFVLGCCCNDVMPFLRSKADSSDYRKM